MATRRENILRAARFEKPDYIPVRFAVCPACWNHYPQEALQELQAEHPLLFPGFKKKAEKIEPKYAPWQRAGQPYTDPWGCVWETSEDGITGAVVRHPLANWDDFEHYRAPDPSKYVGWGADDWGEIAARLQRARERGELVQGSLRHGHTFLTLTYIRGYENVLFDMTDGEPRLRRLLRMIEDYNAEIVRRFLELGVEWMDYPEDLGMQVGPMLSPEHFREYIKPVLARLIAPAREAGCVVHMHSDGDLRTLVPDLLDAGVEVLNPQDLVNGVDWIKAHLTGKICVYLDVDRQKVTRFGTPAEIDALIREEVEKLGSPQGGLLLIYGLYPGVPLANVKAVMDALEKYTGFYS